jgi:two-component system cell cycle sensor histidine kinase/response regulator CckA
MDWFSLRWRLPLVACALLAGVLAAVVWLAYREVEATLLRATGERAQAGADQIGGLLERSIQQGSERLRRAAQDAAVRRYLQRPTEPGREAARGAFAAVSATGPRPRRIEIWSRDGSRLLDISVPGTSGQQAKPVELPPGPPPSVAERGALQALGDIAFSDDVVEVRDRAEGEPGGAVLGFVRVRSTTRENPPGIMKGLLGKGAEIRVGSAGGSVWTDMTRLTPPPLVDSTRRGVSEYRAEDGGLRVGALAMVRGAPYVTWVEFDRAGVVAPARTFRRRLVLLSLIVVALASVMAATASVRITRPLHDLSRAAGEIAAGDFSRRVVTRRRDEIGRLAGAFNTMIEQVARNLAARERAEAALRDREASFRALFADNPLPMWVYDAATLRFLEVNVAAVQHYGYTRDEFQAMTLADIRPAEDVPRLLSRIADKRDAYQQAGQWRHRLKSGTVISVDIMSHTTTFKGHPAVLVVAQDVTERQDLEERLRQSQKMEAVGRLAGGVAHDFNNLLTAITGYTSLLLEELPADQAIRDELQEIQKAANSAASLTRQLLAFSRQQILQPRVLDLNDVVSRMDALLRRLIGEDIDLDTRLSQPLDRVSADPGQIEQIIMNLAVNARDAMPAGGRLTIETANVVLDEAYASQHAGSSPGPHVMLAVSDTGVGMDAETRGRIFEPFFTTKGAGKGTGLGLATAYGIVKQSGGSIWVYSEPGQGATFKVYLPIATDQQIAPPVVMPKPTTVAGTETILVAEDQAEVRAVVRAVLTRYGYTVLEAAHGEDALRILGEYADPIHMVLTDVVMPSISGRELVEQLRRQHPSMKVLYTSGYTDDAIVRHGVLEPGVAFIQKPFTPTALLAKVREVLDTPL